MKILTKTQTDAKQSLLNSQKAKMLAQYQTADQNERAAIIQHISAFVQSARNQPEKNFWLDFSQMIANLSNQPN